MNNQSWQIDRSFFRFSTLIVQTPAVIASKLGLESWAVTWLFCFGYMIYPFFLFGLLKYFYRQSSKIINFFPAFILLFFLCIAPSWGFSVAVIGESIALSWLLLSYIIASEKIVPWKLFALSLPLLLSYELGFIFFIIAGYLLVREKKHTALNFLVLGACLCAQFANILYFIIPHNYHIHFKSSFSSGMTSPLLIPLILAILLSFAPENLKAKYKKWILMILVFLMAIICLSILTGSQKYFSSNSYPNRVWGIPAAAILFLALYEHYRKREYRFNNFILASFCLLSMPAVVLEARALYDQGRIVKIINTMIDKGPRCQVLSRDKWDNLFGGADISDWSFPVMTILFNKTKNPKTIIFTNIHNHNYPYKIIPNNFCQLNQHQQFSVENEYFKYFYSTNKNVNFAQIFK